MRGFACESIICKLARGSDEIEEVSDDGPFEDGSW